MVVTTTDQPVLLQPIVARLVKVEVVVARSASNLVVVCSAYNLLGGAALKWSLEKSISPAMTMSGLFLISCIK